VNDVPSPQGLYDPAYEHDACGVGFVVDMHGRASHRIIDLGIASLCHLDHRGATGAEANVGDGAGILVQVPDGFLRQVVDFDLPDAGTYAVGCAFLPRDPEACAAAMQGIERIAAGEELTVLGWRDVPHDDSMIGQMSRDAEPTFKQVFLATTGEPVRGIAGPTSPASASSTRSARTSHRSRLARWCTRACSSPPS
jgi:glutamate synthase (NADPH) large chain